MDTRTLFKFNENYLKKLKSEIFNVKIVLRCGFDSRKGNKF